MQLLAIVANCRIYTILTILQFSLLLLLRVGQGAVKLQLIKAGCVHEPS